MNMLTRIIVSFFIGIITTLVVLGRSPAYAQCALICSPYCDQAWTFCSGDTQQVCRRGGVCTGANADPVCCTGGGPPPATNTPAPPTLTPTNTPIPTPTNTPAPTLPTPTQYPIAPTSVIVYITVIYQNIADFQYIQVNLKHPTNPNLNQPKAYPNQVNGVTFFPNGVAVPIIFEHLATPDQYLVLAFAEGYNGALGRATVTNCPGTIIALPGGPHCAIAAGQANIVNQRADITLEIPPPVRGTIAGTVTFNFTDRSQFEVLRILLAKNNILPYGSIDIRADDQVNGSYKIQSGVPYPYTFPFLDDGWSYQVSVGVVSAGSGMLIPFVQTPTQVISRVDFCPPPAIQSGNDSCGGLTLNQQANFTLTQIAQPPPNPPISGSSNLSYAQMIALWQQGTIGPLQVSAFITQITRTPNLQKKYCFPHLPYFVSGSCARLD